MHSQVKEAFGLDVIQIYLDNNRQLISQTQANPELTPLIRLRAYLDASIEFISQNEARNGCLFGNFAAEANEYSDVIRHRLIEIFGELEQSVEMCLQAAIEAGELSADLIANKLAKFVISSLQGSILIAKTQRSAEPVENFRDLLFATVLAGRN